MENSRIEQTLDEAQALFNRRPGEVEIGLDANSSETLQLRKACRLLETGSHLLEENGYYTVVVETSFAAIERTIQFYLLENDFLYADEYVNHQTVYERGFEAGLYDEEFAGKLDHLWRNNRSDTYYREGVATEKRAEKMLELAEQIHAHVLQLGGKRHECICNTA